ncbi:alpha-ketoacid dehydrogenase subunit beta [Alphaproteobacteria bacterium]|nr:alpha-ketoacid dehydrogenase subunit beta [Alphaproteobacteria bacterium]
MTVVKNTSYCEAILAGFEYLFQSDPDVFAIGQGLWSPWYVGNSMRGLKEKYGSNRVVDSPVSELAVTGLGVGAGLSGMKAIVIHPRMDFMILAMDQIVNQASNWAFMLNSDKHPNLTIRSIINRGGGQGAQHSQALHAWLAHVPGLNVLMPWSVADARDLLIAAVNSQRPCIYIDDRWLYEDEEPMPPYTPLSLNEIIPKRVKEGSDFTFVGAGFSVSTAIQAAKIMEKSGLSADVFDLRKLTNIDYTDIVASLERTGRLASFDGGWQSCGLASEVVASTLQLSDIKTLCGSPLRITLPASPAPASRNLEQEFYPQPQACADRIRHWFGFA